MQKKWIVAGISVLVVASAMPWVVGYVTEQQWQAVTQEINRSQPFVQVDNGQYQRGYLSSRLQGTLVILNPETGQSQQIGYRASVTHGVIGSYIDFEPEDGWSPKDVDWFPDGSPKLTLESHLWGSAVLELTVPETNLSNDETGETLASSGGTASLSLSGAGTSVEALLNWPSVTLSGPDINIQVSDIHFQQKMKHLRGDIWTGSGDVQIKTASVEPKGQPALILQGLSVSGSSKASPNGERLSSHGNVQLEELNWQGENYGPHQVEMAFDQLDVDSWGRLSESLSEMQVLAAQQKADGKNRFDQQMAAMADVNTALRDLAAAGFSAGIPSLSLMTPEGEVSGDLVIRHPELTPEQKAGMLLVMQQLEGSLNIRIPAALAENYPAVRMQVAPLIKQGLLVQDGEELAMKASLKDLTVDVNGHEIPLPPLF